MMDPVEQLPPLRDVIRTYELAAQKSLGQNFLLDLNLTSKIARQAGDLSGCDVFEVGPGPGGLTRGLLVEGARKVLSVEKDKRCVPVLDEIKDASRGRFSYMIGDAMQINPLDHLTLPIRIVSNLPYNVGTELLIRWMTPDIWPPFWSSLTLMFQKEVAERIVAPPSSKAYGRLALMVQWRADARIVMRLPPEAFSPAPKVESAVVHITALEKPRYEANAKILEKVVAQAFNQRRKMLRAALKSLVPNIETVLESADIEPTQRAETVSLEKFCALARNVEAIRRGD